MYMTTSWVRRWTGRGNSTFTIHHVQGYRISYEQPTKHELASTNLFIVANQTTVNCTVEARFRLAWLRL